MKNKCKPLMILLLSVLAAVFMVKMAVAADCRILKIREIPGSTIAFTADFEITVSLEGTGGGTPFFNGQKAPNSGWGYRPIRDNGDGTATATIDDWEAGNFFEFSYGAKYWTTPNCSKYYYNGHFRVKLGEPKKFAMPWLVPLLINGKINQPKVISIVESNVNGPIADYSITFGLNALSAGAPFFMGQTYQDGPWTSYGVKDNGDGTFTSVIPNWSRGGFCEFGFGRIVGGKYVWVDPSGSSYIYAGHFGSTLGQSQVCSINDQNDPLVRKIRRINGSVYRIHLGFPMEEGFSSLFVKGQIAPNAPWVSYAVGGTYPCYFTDIYWPYSGTFHFSFGIIKNDGTTERWIDPTRSKFRCDDHLCITPTLY